MDELSLESIVPLLKTKPNRAKFKDANGVFNKKAYLAAKKQLEEQAKNHRKKTIDTLNNFFNIYCKKILTKVYTISNSY